MSEKLKYSLAISLFVLAAVVYFFGFYLAGAAFFVLSIGFFAAAIMHAGPPYEDDNF